MAWNGDDNEEDTAVGERSRLPSRQPEAQSAAAVRPTVVAGRISGSQMRAEMEEFFRDDEDDPDRGSCGDDGRGTTSVHLQEELASRGVNPLGTKGKSGSHSPNDPEGAYTRGGGLMEVGTRGAAEPGGLLSEEFSEFLSAEDDGGDDNSATPRLRTSGDVSSRRGGSNLRTSSIRGKFSTAGALEDTAGGHGRGGSGDVRRDIGSEAADCGGAEENVHHQEACRTGWKGAPRGAEFSDFLNSDDEDSESDFERDPVAFPSRRRPPRASRQPKETATGSGDGRSYDERGVVESGRAERGDAPRGRPPAASEAADAGSEPARSPGGCAVPCNSGTGKYATRGLPARSPTGRAGLEEPLTSRAERPPSENEGGSETGTPVSSREATPTGEALPHGGRARGSGPATRKTRETRRKPDIRVGSGVAGGSSRQGSFSPGDETSRWEVSGPQRPPLLTFLLLILHFT